MHYGGATYTNLVSVTATKGQWAQFTGQFTIPASQSVATARLFFETPWTSNPAADSDLHLMDFTLDDVSVVGAPPPAAPSKTIEVVGKLPGEHNPLIAQVRGRRVRLRPRRPGLPVPDQRHPGVRAEPGYRRLTGHQLWRHQPDYGDIHDRHGELDRPRRDPGRGLERGSAVHQQLVGARHGPQGGRR
ncbi:hypothetical protein [Micromonospora sp. LOL_023]|uniref:hypothetical protein n=1 Tax=Micromonospora sp. LOL_023 TaxID=3345418 RepID=UPI003A8C01AE